ncbi:hypothetical protein ACFVYF_24410 [Streptomyces sp. NPDC058274]|uniref:hypothetical protein n=1 Tax=Streptomyces sp. NPDC058274 TaxID=3346416 RepID=UPI0036E8C52A
MTTARQGEAWLLVKADHERARPGGGHGTPEPRRARSARSGRTLHQVAEEVPGSGRPGLPD